MKYRLLMGRTDADLSAIESAVEKVTDSGTALMTAIELVQGPLDEVRSDGDPHARLMEVGRADIGMLSLRDESPGVVVWMIEHKDVAQAAETLRTLFADPDVKVKLEIDDDGDTGWVRTTKEFGPNDVDPMPKAAVNYGRCVLELCSDAAKLGGALVVIGTSVD
jgi:hypothetical protein